MSAVTPVFRWLTVANLSVLPYLDRSKRPLQWLDLAEGRLRLDNL